MKKKHVILTLLLFVYTTFIQSQSCQMPNAVFQSGANFGDSFLTPSPSYSFWFSSILKKPDQDYFYLNSNIVQSPFTSNTFTERNFKMLHLDKNAMTYLDRKIKLEDKKTRILTMVPKNTQEYFLSGTTEVGPKSRGFIKKYLESSPTDTTYLLTENFWIPLTNLVNLGDVIIKTIEHQGKTYSIGYTMFADSFNTTSSYSRRPIIYVNDGNSDYFYNFDHRGAVIDIISNQQDVYIITIEDAAMNAANPTYIYKLNEQNNQIELEGQQYITDLILPNPAANPPVFFSKMDFNNAGDKIYVLFRYGSHNLPQTKGYGGFIEFDLNLKELNAYHFDFPRLPLCVDYINNGPPTPIPDIFLSCMQFDQNDNILIGGLYKNYSHPFQNSQSTPQNLLGSITLLFDHQNPSTFFGYEENITTQPKETSPFFKTGSAVNSNALDNKLPEFIALTSDKSRLHIVGTNDEIYWDGIAPNRYPNFTKSILKHKSRPVQDYYDQSTTESCDTCIYSTFLGSTRYPRFLSSAHRRFIKSNQHNFLIREGKFMEIKSSEDYLTTCMDTIKDTVTGCHYPVKIARSTDTLCKNGTIRLHAITSTPYWNQSLLWNNGSTDTFIDVTKEGTYSIIWTRYLTNGAVCEMYDTVKIHKPIDAKIETIFDIDEICQGEKIEIKSTPVLQKSYLWYSNNIVLSNTKGINVLIPGTYTVQVTMQNGCVDTVSKRIYQKGLTLKQSASNTNPALQDTITLTATICNNESTVANNTPFEAILPSGFVYVGSNIAGLVYDSASRKVSYDIPTIAARIGDSVTCMAISYQVKAINLCKVKHQMQITNPTCFPPTLIDSLYFNTQSSHQVSITTPKTKGCQKEAILLSANISPNTDTTSYQWKLNDTVIPNATSNNYFTNKTGSYTVEAKKNVCVVESNKLQISISDTLKTIDTIKDNFCFGTELGMIHVIPSGGYAPYKFKWSKGKDTSSIAAFKDSSLIKNLKSDTFHVTISDSNNCKISKTFIVKNQKSISFDLIDTVNSDCNKNNGSVLISNINAYDTSIISFYSVTNSSDILDKKITNLAPGKYLIRMTDTNKCINEKSVLIKRINIPFGLEINKKHKCSLWWGGVEKGSIHLTPKGKSPYTYKWNDGDTKSYKTYINEGTYIVTVTDSNLCEKRDTINVLASPKMDSIKISASIITCLPENNKNLYKVNFIGGTAPFTYNWAPAPESTSNNTAVILNNPDLIYVTVTDALGCSANILKHESDIFVSYKTLGEKNNKPTKSSAASLFTNNIIDSDYLIIEGNFTIDQAATIQNSEIILSNYYDNGTLKLGKITSAVPNNIGDFKLINCTIRTCNYELAHGIIVDNSNIWMQGNKVYDMITGLSLNNNVKLFLYNNLFENNRIGIEYATTAGNLTPFPTTPNIITNQTSMYHFTGNTFIGGSLKTNLSPLIWSNNYPNTIGSNLNYSYIGIASKNNIGFDIGKSSGVFPNNGNVYPQNKFYKINNGIVLTQGNYTIKNFKIYDYNDEVVPTYTPTKKGIVAINSANIEPTSSIGAKLVVNGDNDSTNFFSLTHGIETNGYELEVSKTKMHFIEQAAITYNASNNRLFNKFNIQHNQFISTKQFTFNYIDNTSRPTQGNFSNNQIESGNFINSNPLINYNKSILSNSANESLTINNNKINNQRNIITLSINRFRNIDFSNNQFITGGLNVNIDAKITNCIDLFETNNKYNTTYSGNGKNEASIINSFSINNIYPLNALYDNVSNATISCNNYIGYSNILFMNNLSGLNLTNNNFVGRNHRILIDQNSIFPKQVLKGNRFYFATRASGAKDIFSKVATNSPILFETKGLPSIISIPSGAAPIINSDGCPTDFYWNPNTFYLSPTNVIQTISSSIKEPFECCLGRRVTQFQARPIEQQLEAPEVAYTYPNPTNGAINIEFFNPIEGLLSIEVYDLNSNCVLKLNKETVNNQLNFDASHLLSGIYLIKVLKNNETLYQTKIEIKKSIAK